MCITLARREVHRTKERDLVKSYKKDSTDERLHNIIHSPHISTPEPRQTTMRLSILTLLIALPAGYAAVTPRTACNRFPNPLY